MTALVTALHLACLSMVETGGNDAVVGTHGEVTRYQIGVAEMRHHPDLRKDPTNTALATKYAAEIWEHRAFHFCAEFNRAPTPFEFYVIWNNPAGIRHPSSVVSERARRFENLLLSMEPARH